MVLNRIFLGWGVTFTFFGNDVEKLRTFERFDVAQRIQDGR